MLTLPRVLSLIYALPWQEAPGTEWLATHRRELGPVEPSLLIDDSIELVGGGLASQELPG